jgi:hypothetical protein
MAERVDVDERNRGEFSGGAVREERRMRRSSERSESQRPEEQKTDVEMHIGKASE